MNKKYELKPTDLIAPNGKPLFRVVAIRDVRFGVPKGVEGGLVESEKNLDHDGNAWVSGNAWVFGDARVFGDAWVSGNAWVFGDARVSGNAQVSGKTIIVSGWAFATKHPDWKITEVQMGDYVTLVKDYKTAEPEPPCAKRVTIEGVEYELVPVKS